MLLKAVDHCRYMVRIIQDSSGAKEPQTAIIIQSILILLDNARGNVAADLLRSMEPDGQATALNNEQEPEK